MYVYMPYNVIGVCRLPSRGPMSGLVRHGDNNAIAAEGGRMRGCANQTVGELCRAMSDYVVMQKGKLNDECF